MSQNPLKKCRRPEMKWNVAAVVAFYRTNVVLVKGGVIFSNSLSSLSYMWSMSLGSLGEVFIQNMHHFQLISFLAIFWSPDQKCIDIAIWDVCKSISTFFIFATYLFTFHLAYGINDDDDRNNNNNNNNKERQGQETWERRGTWVPTFYGETI